MLIGQGVRLGAAANFDLPPASFALDMQEETAFALTVRLYHLNPARAYLQKFLGGDLQERPIEPPVFRSSGEAGGGPGIDEAGLLPPLWALNYRPPRAPKKSSARYRDFRSAPGTALAGMDGAHRGADLCLAGAGRP